MNQESLKIFPLTATDHGDTEKALLAGAAVDGWCPVCGRSTRFIEGGENLRETCACEHCRSTNRQRQMGYVLLRVLEEMRQVRLHSLADVAPMTPPVRIHNAETSGAVHTSLQDCLNYTCSEYFGPGHASGQLINGIRHEDLTHSSFDSDSLDVLMSSDVFEHIPDPYAAHAEVYRVLRPGGRHVFTVPFLWDRWLDERRAALNPDGSITHFMEPEVHGDPVRPDQGILVFLKPSIEMCVKLAHIGFEPRIYRPYIPACGIVGLALVFDAVKPASATRVGR